MERGPPCSRLKGASPDAAAYTVLPDRMEAATFLAAAASAGGDLCLERTRPGDYGPVIQVLRAAGCRIEEGSGEVRIHGPERLQSVPPIRTAPYPGFPTDAQAPVMAALLRAQGVTVFEETVLLTATVMCLHCGPWVAGFRSPGPLRLSPGCRSSMARPWKPQTCRGGAAMVVGALGAQGTSRIGSVQHILRGYEDFARRLAALGATIRWKIERAECCHGGLYYGLGRTGEGAQEKAPEGGTQRQGQTGQGRPLGRTGSRARQPDAGRRKLRKLPAARRSERSPSRRQKNPPRTERPGRIRNRRASRNSVSGTHLEIGRWRKKPEKPAADRPGKRSGRRSASAGKRPGGLHPRHCPGGKLLWKLLTTAAVVVALLWA